MSEDRDEVTVYWAPAVVTNTDPSKRPEWDAMYGQILYPNLRTLQSDLMSEKNPHRGPTTYLSCPAATTTFRKTAVVYNGMSCSYKFDISDQQNPMVEPMTEKYMNMTIRRPPALMGKPTMEFQLRWVFFAEESLRMIVSPPSFHKPKYMKYGTCIPGEYDIGRWFRPVVFEVQAWEETGELHFEAGEPLMYAMFDTDKKVKLQRFIFSDILAAHSIDALTFTTGEGRTLEERYEIFETTGLKEMITKEIKANLVD